MLAAVSLGGQYAMTQLLIDFILISFALAIIGFVATYRPKKPVRPPPPRELEYVVIRGNHAVEKTREPA